MRKLLFLAALTVLLFGKQTPYALASQTNPENLQFIQHLFKTPQLATRVGSSFSAELNTPWKKGAGFIYIPSLDIFLPIQTAKIQNNEWKLNDDKAAFFGQGSAYPGTKGVSVVFAHAKQDLFALLPKLKSGDDIIIISNQKMFLYTVTKRQIVSPQNTEILQKNNTYKLLVFTCFGKNDQERIAFYATLYMETNLTRDDKDLYD